MRLLYLLIYRKQTSWRKLLMFWGLVSVSEVTCDRLICIFFGRRCSFISALHWSLHPHTAYLCRIIRRTHFMRSIDFPSNTGVMKNIIGFVLFSSSSSHFSTLSPSASIVLLLCHHIQNLPTFVLAFLIVVILFLLDLIFLLFILILLLLRLLSTF
jgi:hypothetical protein